MQSDASTDSMVKQIPHISVCICTYKRPDLLHRLLEKLCGQETNNLFTFSVVVADNDRAMSAEPIVANFAAINPGVPVVYCVETRQNIALARNKATANSTGEFVAFIDDDELPIERWLLMLFLTCNKQNVDGVLGPVKPYYDNEPPRWVIDGRFYDRETYPTGLVIDWRMGRTGNTFLRRRIFNSCEQPFNPVLRNGEDQEFFYRMIQNGFVFIWCNEAVAYEVVPPIRWQRTFMLKRALLRGSVEPYMPTFGARDIVKSLIAVPAYIIVLPLTPILGHHKFMTCLVRLCDHLGKLLAVIGIRPIKEAYVTE